MPTLPAGEVTNSHVENLVVDLTESLVLANAEREILREWVDVNCR